MERQWWHLKTGRRKSGCHLFSLWVLLGKRGKNTERKTDFSELDEHWRSASLISLLHTCKLGNRRWILLIFSHHTFRWSWFEFYPKTFIQSGKKKLAKHFLLNRQAIRVKAEPGKLRKHDRSWCYFFFFLLTCHSKGSSQTRRQLFGVVVSKLHASNSDDLTHKANPFSF